MRKQATLTFALAILLTTTLRPLLNKSYAENISPIESIEWGESPTSSSQEEETSADESAQESSSEEETPESEASSEASSEVIETTEPTESAPVELDTTSPLAFLEGISQLDPRSVEYVYFVTEGESMDVISQNSLKDGEKYYTAQLVPPFLPSAVFFRSDREAVQEAYLSVDDLIQYAADALNTQPQIYVGTIVEDFYVFTQENYEELQGKVVHLNSTEASLNQNNLEMLRVEDYLTDVALEWLANEDVQAAFEANEMGEQVMINGENGVLFNEIAQEKRADYPELAEFFDRATSDIEGTINVDYTNQVFGMGLVATNDAEQVTGIELYLLANSGRIIDFSDEIVYSQDEFTEFVGFDVIEQIKELEAGLTPDMFETPEE